MIVHLRLAFKKAKSPWIGHNTLALNAKFNMASLIVKRSIEWYNIYTYMARVVTHALDACVTTCTATLYIVYNSR